MIVDWTKEKIAEKSDADIQSLRENAATLGRHDIVDMCNQELARRKPPRRIIKEVGDDRMGQYVSEFHFVCPSELGVTYNRDGTIWSGTWVVAEKHVENAVKYGGLIALHSSKAEHSYLQGTISGWRRSARQPRYSSDQLTQIREGIDFLFEPSTVPLKWKGDATGEKGYAWSPYP